MTEETPKVNPFLAETLARKRVEVEAGRRARPLSELRRAAADRPAARPWAAALRGEGARVIAEVKRRSPSAGRLADDVDPAARARSYAAAGAAAVSVLTDAAFDGSLADLRTVADAVDTPVLRKDFLVDPWQAWESRAAGADAVLVLLAALEPPALEAILDAAAEAGLGTLVEVHGPDEAERAIALGPAVVGVNARDLATLEVSTGASLETLAGLRRRVGPQTVLVAESGIRGPADVLRARAAGADAVLVGEHLMRAADPRAALAALLR